MCGSIGNIFKIDIVWPDQVGTSNWFPPLIYLIFTAVVAVVFVAGQILHIIDFIEEFGPLYYGYLTQWNLLVGAITNVALFICTAWAYAISGSSPKPAPMFVRYTIAFWYIIQPITLIVVILYWTLINPFFDNPRPVPFSSLFAHLFNWFVLLVSLFASRIPWSFKNGIWGLLFLAAYLLWTLIHFFARIGTNEPCELYPQPECPLYDEFDWNQPGMTFVITLVALVAYVLVAGIYTAFFRCRDACGGAASMAPAEGKGSETKDVEAVQNGEAVQNVEAKEAA